MGILQTRVFVVKLPSEAVVRLFRQVDPSPLGDPAKFALKLMSIFFLRRCFS